jgi:hypothetical protein
MSNKFGFDNGFIFGFDGKGGSGRVREPLQGPNVVDGIVQQNGFNTYQLSFEPNPDTLEVYSDGLLLKEGVDRDFVLNGTNIVFTEAPTEGVSLEAIYIKA